MSDTVILAMKFESHGEFWYQRQRQKRSSAPAEWHSRTDNLRGLGKAIAAYNRKKGKRHGLGPSGDND